MSEKRKSEARLDDCGATGSERKGDGVTAPKRLKKVEACLFGVKCYRKNPAHFQAFSHPHLEALLDDPKAMDKLASLGADTQVCAEQMDVLNDIFLERQGVASCTSPPPAPPPSSAARLYFLTKVKDLSATHKGSIFLTDLLKGDRSGAKLKSSLQINFMVDFDWLWMSYEATGTQALPLALVYGELNAARGIRLPANVTAHRVNMPIPFGTHHTKMMILVYNDDSVRVVVHTANLVPSDWENRTQGVWVSAKCPAAPSQVRAKDSVTGFKTSLLMYLRHYQLSSILDPFIEAVDRCDFDQVKEHFVASVPGSHCTRHWGHWALADLLRRNLKPHVSRWPLVVQCSSIGSLGVAPNDWLQGELAASLGGQGCTDVRVVYPSKSNVLAGLDGALGGGCLPYSKSTHAKQTWFLDHLHQWKADSVGRTRAMPHIKTYAKVSEDCSSLGYLLLTSANLSKSAWGSESKGKDKKLLIRSYEVGVLFLPQFVVGAETFDLKQHDFLLPYDLPLTKYSQSCYPWFADHLYSTNDS